MFLRNDEKKQNSFEIVSDIKGKAGRLARQETYKQSLQNNEWNFLQAVVCYQPDSKKYSLSSCIIYWDDQEDKRKKEE